ncbi:MAG: 4Fe-4S binding protein [Desulfobacteraceae bacterium]|nr:4Fe-4S binding protein [Desulfobacteraceae bacterium]
MSDLYIQLARHLQDMVMGYPFNDALVDMLKSMFTPREAEVALAIPNDLLPLQAVGAETIAARSGLDPSAVDAALASMADKNVIFSKTLASGRMAFALLQTGFGMPQSFFWGGKTDDRARKMAGHVRNYFSIDVTRDAYASVPTKSYKYIPADAALDIPVQSVVPHDCMETIIAATEKIAVAHCPCRISAQILGRTDCSHSLEVCLKYDELADFIISKGLGKEISRDHARQILADCEKEGLVHMVDNAASGIKHTCNCCGHYCWNVGIIKRRKIPRDVLMAVHYIRENRSSDCIGCGECVTICPVSAVDIKDDIAVVDQDWCIGCGVCAVVCPTASIRLTKRDKMHSPENFTRLYTRIQSERG